MGTKWTCFDNSSGYVCYHVTGEYFSFGSSTGFKLFAELYTDIQYVNVHLHIMHFRTYMYVVECSVKSVGVVGSNPTRGSSFVFGKVTAYPVFCCMVCLYAWPCLLLSSFLVHV